MDVYRQMNEISWKKEADALPLFGIDYEKSGFLPIEEAKPLVKDGKKVMMKYYPGSIFVVKMPRNPIQSSLQFFAPAIILSVFILCSNNITGEDSLADMLGTVSLSLLTLVALYQQIRDAMPETLEISFIEKIVIIYIMYSLVPVIDNVAFDSSLAGWKSFLMWSTLNFFVCIVFFMRFVHQYKISKDRDPPKQIKAAGDRKAPDAEWYAPV